MYSSIANGALLVGWGIWSTGDPGTGDVVFAECSSTGSGAWSSSCASFPILPTASEASQHGVNNVFNGGNLFIDTSF
jgi:hypothetical protein